MLNAVFAAILAAVPAILGDILPQPGALMVADRRIDIPNLPDRTVAYNPSVARHQGNLYLIFRLDRFDMGWATQMQLGIVQLSEDFHVIRGPALLDTRDMPWTNHTSEDPRMIEHRGELYVVFNATHDGSMNSRRAIRVGRIKVPQSNNPADQFEVLGVSELVPNEPGFRPWQEKNWTPFVHNDALHLVYRTNPPKILRVANKDLDQMPQEIRVDQVSDASGAMPFNFGEMRGGSTAALNGDINKYISFFHAREAKNYGGGYKMHYFIGFYAFDPEPPFAISHVLPYPIVVPTMINPKKPYLEVAYPGGFIDGGDVFHVFYGKNDLSIRVLTIDKWRLFDSAVDVQAPPDPDETPQADLLLQQ